MPTLTFDASDSDTDDDDHHHPDDHDDDPADANDPHWGHPTRRSEKPCLRL